MYVHIGMYCIAGRGRSSPTAQSLDASVGTYHSFLLLQSVVLLMGFHGLGVTNCQILRSPDMLVHVGLVHIVS